MRQNYVFGKFAQFNTRKNAFNAVGFAVGGKLFFINIKAGRPVAGKHAVLTHFFVQRRRIRIRVFADRKL